MRYCATTNLNHSEPDEESVRSRSLVCTPGGSDLAVANPQRAAAK
jgi:hypothetical protein